MGSIFRRRQERVATAAQWVAKNPVLMQAEIGVEVDAEGMPTAFKLGDGATAWVDLPYFTSGGGEVTIDDLPAGSVITVEFDGIEWPARPTDRTDVRVWWIDYHGTAPFPPTAIELDPFDQVLT